MKNFDKDDWPKESGRCCTYNNGLGATHDDIIAAMAYEIKAINKERDGFIRRLTRIADILGAVDLRLKTVRRGWAKNLLEEITEKELRRIYRLAKGKARKR